MTKTNKIIIGVALAGLGAMVGYLLYKNRFPTFVILQANALDKYIEFRYGSQIHTASALSNETFYEDLSEDYAVNVSPITNETGEVIGVHFHFLDKDTRPAQYIYF